MQKNPKIPTLLGLLIVAALVGLVIYFGERLPPLTLFAAKGISADNVEVTNVNDNSASVSWTTQTPTTGSIVISGEKLKEQKIVDDRDGPARVGTYVTHQVTVRNIAAGSDYTVIPVVNGKRIASDGSIHVHTFPQLPASADNTLGPAYGSVVTEAGAPAAGALVYLTVEGGQMLSTLVSPSGSWLIAVNRLRTADGSSYLPVTERMTETITVRTSQQDDAQATTDTLNDSPVPVMAIGKSYDFRKQQAKGQDALTIKTPPGEKPSVLGTTSPSVKPTNTVSLIAPAEGAALPATRPLIRGTGVPGKSVVITLGITGAYSDTTTVGTDGLWSYTPKKPLGIGKQSVTITSTDTKDKSTAITHLFQILKSGTQVLGEATPSATLTLTPTLVASPSPTSTLSGQPIPTTGSLLPTLIVLILGFGLVASGALFLL